MKAYDRYFFDCDGVILDSNEIKSSVFFESALPFGQDVAERFLKFHQENGGISRFEKIKYLYQQILKESPTQAAIDEMISRVSVIMKRRLLDADLIPGIIPFLESLDTKAQKFVVSASMESELREIFEHKGLSRFFDGIYGSPRTKYDIIENLGVGGRSVFFGDSKLDYMVADQFKMDFVFISGVSEFKNWREFFEDKKISGHFPDFRETILRIS